MDFKRHELAAVTSDAPTFSIIVAAQDEEHFIRKCIASLAMQVGSRISHVEIVVVANACKDKTVEFAIDAGAAVIERGWRFEVLNLEKGGKINAIRAGENVATGRNFAYLDADVVCDRDLFDNLAAALEVPVPRYATGILTVTRARTFVTRAYAGVWTKLPFIADGASGAGLFAVNRAGRVRWNEWPDIISDDTFARLHFSPDERVEVPAKYYWPMVEGFANLVRVRRRQDAGVTQIFQLYPSLKANDIKSQPTPRLLLQLLKGNLLGLAIYAAVHIIVRMRAPPRDWTRAR